MQGRSMRIIVCRGWRTTSNWRWTKPIPHPDIDRDPKTMISAAMALASAALFVGCVHAATPDRMARFQLFNECAPMDVVVEDLDSDAWEIGLTEDTLRAAVENRLRATRLYDGEADSPVPALYLNVGVEGKTYVVSLEYIKKVCRPAIKQCGIAPTWRTGSFGTHEGDAQHIRSDVSEHIDEFIVEYLRINEEACSSG